MGVEFLGCLEEMNFLRPPVGGWGFIESFMDDVKLRGFPPWRKSNLVFSRARIKATAYSFCCIVKYSSVQHPVCGVSMALKRERVNAWASVGY